MANEDEEKLDIDLAVTRLNEAFCLQCRSALAFVAFSGSVVGFEYQAVGAQL